MNVKIDTKEIFYVISILDVALTANMSATLQALIAKKQEEAPKSIVINLAKVNQIEQGFATSLANLSASLYASNKSCVVCEINAEIEQQLLSWGLVEELNTTPTESEAWDIVQMEEIERELGAEFSE